MDTMTEVLPATKSSKSNAVTWVAGEKPGTGLVTILSTRAANCRYAVEEFACDGGRGFMLFKLDAGTDATEERYACFLSTKMPMHCECKGFAYGRGKACRHLAALLAVVENEWL